MGREASPEGGLPHSSVGPYVARGPSVPTGCGGGLESHVRLQTNPSGGSGDRRWLLQTPSEPVCLCT